MDNKELRNLQEAYIDVYAEEKNSMRLPGETGRQFKRHQKRNQELLDARKKRQEDRQRNKNPLFFGKDGKMNKTQREQVDLYDIILSHLLDEGYAETPEAAEAMMVNMSEEWRDSIMEGYKRFPYKKVEDKIHKKEADNPSGRGTPQTINMGKVIRHFRGEVRRTEKRENSPQISKAKEAENRRRGNKG